MFCQPALRMPSGISLFALIFAFGCSKNSGESAAPPSAIEPAVASIEPSSPAKADVAIDAAVVVPKPAEAVVAEADADEPSAADDELSIDADEEEVSTLVAGERTILASAVEATDDKAAYLKILVRRPTGNTSLRLQTDLADCEYVRAQLDGIPKIKDKRVIMAQLFCENGEDEFNRDMVTALLFTGLDEHPPAILWQGKGHYGNSFGACEETDVVHFERKKPNKVSVFRTTSVVHHGKVPDCKPKPKRKQLITTIYFAL